MRLQRGLLLWLLLSHWAQAATTYDAVVVKQLPHGRQDFTQGLEIHAGKLYQSTGRYGRSEIQVIDLENGALLQRKKLPRQLFGEGITLLQDKLIQLTWRAGIARVYQRPELQLVQE